MYAQSFAELRTSDLLVRGKDSGILTVSQINVVMLLCPLDKKVQCPALS